jgi:2-keto-3-deoxy-L-rhamnonate aldolase RhmA
MDDYATYIRESSRLCWKILQIDHVDSVRNLGQIAQVPGVDCWMIGPNDLSVSLGLHGQSDAPEVQEVLDQIAEKATQWGVVLGAFVGDSPAAVRQWKARGVRLFTIGSDTGYLMSSARSSLRQVRETAQGKAWGVGASP